MPSRCDASFFFQEQNASRTRVKQRSANHITIKTTGHSAKRRKFIIFHKEAYNLGFISVFFDGFFGTFFDNFSIFFISFFCVAFNRFFRNFFIFRGNFVFLHSEIKSLKIILLYLTKTISNFGTFKNNKKNTTYCYLTRNRQVSYF